MERKPGDKLGPYEIVSLLGKGGMGEVWRAHDPQIGRDVAIKVSAQQFTDRFEREVRAIGALNHPNICTLYHVGPNYLVMELVEGPTLAERIKEGPIPLEEALGVAKQIADALEAAHEKNIVHRDLKPDNVKIRPDGSVKVLDFGLAKAGEAQEVTPDSPTMMPGTQMGMILGTAGYMSPEQARGKEVDKRADIWAFGVVLYEIVTGKRLFQGEDLTETLASVVKDKPDLSGVPAQVRPLLNRCLEKDPKKRLRDIGDAMAWVATERAAELSAAAPSLSRLSMAGWVAAAVLAVGFVVAGVGWYHVTRPAGLKPLVRLDVDLGADVSLPAPTAGRSSIAISPDGTRLAYTSGTPAKLFTRRLDQAKATELPGTQGASIPFFSPDGQWVGFVTSTKLNKISVEGGAVVPLGDVGNFSGASWGEDGDILVTDLFKGLVRVPAGGGPPEMVAEVIRGETGFTSPWILPGGKAVLFSRYSAPAADATRIEVLTLADRRRRLVVPGGSSARYLPASGHLVYVDKGTMFAVPFDPARLETHGTAVPVLDDVATASGFGLFDFARTGTLVYRKSSGGASGNLTTLEWITSSDGATGKKEPLLAKPGDYADPAISPDGKRVALVVREGGGLDVWVYDPQRNAMTRLTFGGGSYVYPVWSPDGQYVLFASLGNGIFQARADGASQPQALTRSKSTQVPWSFTPDGRRLAYFEVASNPQIWTVPVAERGGQLKAGEPEQFLTNTFDSEAPSFSPDGRWLAYGSNESGKDEAYVRAFSPPASGQGGKWQISNSGGRRPRWSGNGHELMYQAGDQIMAASYAVKGDTFVPDKPRVWIAKLGATPAVGRSWDLSPDGKRVVVVTPVESAEAPKQEHEVVMLLNFSDELRRKVPVSK
jgi:Tol biopolymer transport system component